MSSLPSVVLVSVARTPIGKFRGGLKSLSATQLGAIAIRGALDKLPETIPPPSQVIMGNVLSAGIGQAPARQASIYANLPQSTVCTTINKVCASGMKSAMLAAQSIMLGESDTVVAGGMESMSNAPHLLTGGRDGMALGPIGPLLDSVVHDGLWDVYNNQHMGMCGEKCALDYCISREDQDSYCKMSYERAIEAQKCGKFADEIVPVQVKGRRSSDDNTVTEDEEPNSVKMDKITSLRPAFTKENDGTITAANASSINDGASALVLMNEEIAIEMGISPLARIISFADAEQDPVNFTTTPSLAVQIALSKANMQLDDIHYHEINEAFSVVALANMKLLDNLDVSKVNVFGGAVSLGHPIGMSGARILGTLYSVLKDKNGSIGCASICNGGGGASALIMERLK